MFLLVVLGISGRANLVGLGIWVSILVHSLSRRYAISDGDADVVTVKVGGSGIAWQFPWSIIDSHPRAVVTPRGDAGSCLKPQCSKCWDA